MSRAIVIGGGGQRGSRTAGTIHLIKHQYTLLVGTSTGAGMATVVNRKDALKKAYTTTENGDIWTKRGVNKKDSPLVPVAFVRTIKGKKSSGESGNLIKTIYAFYPLDYHLQCQKDRTEIVVCVWNHTRERIQYFSNLEHHYLIFCKFIEASMSAPPAMNMVEHNGELLEDGGVRMPVPLAETVRMAKIRNIKDIDCFIHESKNKLYKERKKDRPKNPVHRLMRDLQSAQRGHTINNINEGLLLAEINKINVHLYYLPEDDIKPSFYFIPKLQTEWFNRDRIISESYYNA